MIDLKMQWGLHIEAVASKLTRDLYFLRHLFNIVSTTVLRTTYFAAFHSHVSYAVVVWGMRLVSSVYLDCSEKLGLLFSGLDFRDDFVKHVSNNWVFSQCPQCTF